MYLCNEKRNKRFMARFVQITSVHNDKVKFVAELQQKSSLRRETGLAVVEGRRELTHWNVAVIVVSYVSLIAPSHIISTIKPTTTLRYE